MGEDGAFNSKVCWCPSQASTQHINILFCLFRYTNKVTLSLQTKTGSSTLRSASTLTSFTGFNATYEYLVQSFLNIPTNSASVRRSTLRSVSSLTSFPGFNATYEYLFNLFQMDQHTHLESMGEDGAVPKFYNRLFSKFDLTGWWEYFCCQKHNNWLQAQQVQWPWWGHHWQRRLKQGKQLRRWGWTSYRDLGYGVSVLFQGLICVRKCSYTASPSVLNRLTKWTEWFAVTEAGTQ